MADASQAQGPDKLAKTLFILVMAGAAGFVAAVFLFAL